MSRQNSNISVSWTSPSWIKLFSSSVVSSQTQRITSSCVKVCIIARRMFAHHFAQINQRITHSSQCRVDTHAGCISNLLKAHVLIVSHYEHFSLLIRQAFNQISKMSMCFFPDLTFFIRIFGKIKGIENTATVFQYDIRVTFITPEIINRHIMRDSKNPRQKFTFFVVFARAQNVNCLDECILHQIFCHISVFNNQIYGSINFRLVSQNKRFKSTLITVDVE
ncbi:hypothetical protein FGO68_gene17508 [Halteria grandinella]|uniref:Uncharacterized protein n=1 Tax=Halteria grandinella TaxID=5974 RepID=A0A8J8NAU7_HALGN|nr:hypothetical protein FGO68_gene17508 [Halteria grandinella]